MSTLSINPSRSAATMGIQQGGNRHIEAVWHGVRTLNRRYQVVVDSLTPYHAYRWAGTLGLLLLFLLRILAVQGWYVVTYALSIYLLNAFLLFLSPKFQPSVDDMDNEADLEDEGPALPTKLDDEFRPFIRRLPEFVFW